MTSYFRFGILDDDGFHYFRVKAVGAAFKPDSGWSKRRVEGQHWLAPANTFSVPLVRGQPSKFEVGGAPARTLLATADEVNSIASGHVSDGRAATLG
jgi:hypothetical protein